MPACYGDALIRALMEAGARVRHRALRHRGAVGLRIEKGHVAGNELNGQTTARDLGLGRMMSSKKDFIGRAMSERPALLARTARRSPASDRSTAAKRSPAGAISSLAAPRPARVRPGHMTSVAFSPTLGRYLGLGLLKHGKERHGERVRA